MKVAIITFPSITTLSFSMCFSVCVSVSCLSVSKGSQGVGGRDYTIDARAAFHLLIGLDLEHLVKGTTSFS